MSEPDLGWNEAQAEARELEGEERPWSDDAQVHDLLCDQFLEFKEEAREPHHAPRPLLPPAARPLPRRPR